MGIWLDRDSRIAVQGLTGRNGQFHARQMLDYGTPLVGGVTPGKGGSECLGLPVWDTVAEAVDNGANTSCVFVPPRFAAAAIREAVDAGIGLVVAITEGIPALDMVRTKPHQRSVSTGPGFKALTVMPKGANSSAMARVKLIPAALAAPGVISK